MQNTKCILTRTGFFWTFPRQFTLLGWIKPFKEVEKYSKHEEDSTYAVTSNIHIVSQRRSNRLVYSCTIHHKQIKPSSTQRSPLICEVNFFTFVAVFLLHLLSFLGQVSPHTLATTIRFRGSTFLQVLTSFLLSCIGAL